MTADLACKAQISTFSHGREVEGGGGGGGGGGEGERKKERKIYLWKDMLV